MNVSFTSSAMLFAALEDGQVLLGEVGLALDPVLGKVCQVVVDVGAVLGGVERELVAEVVELLVDVAERRVGFFPGLGVAQIADGFAELLAVALCGVLLTATQRRAGLRRQRRQRQW